jgi:hypothetical protein
MKHGIKAQFATLVENVATDLFYGSAWNPIEIDQSLDAWAARLSSRGIGGPYRALLEWVAKGGLQMLFWQKRFSEYVACHTALAPAPLPPMWVEDITTADYWEGSQRLKRQLDLTLLGWPNFYDERFDVGGEYPPSNLIDVPRAGMTVWEATNRSNYRMSMAAYLHEMDLRNTLGPSHPYWGKPYQYRPWLYQEQVDAKSVAISWAQFLSPFCSAVITPKQMEMIWDAVKQANELAELTPERKPPTLRFASIAKALYTMAAATLEPSSDMHEIIVDEPSTENLALHPVSENSDPFPIAVLEMWPPITRPAQPHDWYPIRLHIGLVESMETWDDMREGFAAPENRFIEHVLTIPFRAKNAAIPPSTCGVILTRQ